MDTKEEEANGPSEGQETSKAGPSATSSLDERRRLNDPPPYIDPPGYPASPQPVPQATPQSRQIQAQLHTAQETLYAQQRQQVQECQPTQRDDVKRQIWDPPREEMQEQEQDRRPQEQELDPSISRLRQMMETARQHRREVREQVQQQLSKQQPQQEEQADV